MAQRVKYVAIKGDNIHHGSAAELEKLIGIPSGTIRQACYHERATRGGYRIYRPEDAPIRITEQRWTKDPEPWIELAAAIARDIILDYQRSPTSYNRKMLESEYFQILTLGTIDPSSVKASKFSSSSDLSPEKLEDAMIELGLTTADLAKLSGIDTSSIKNYLTGYFAPRDTTILKLEMAVGRDLRK